MMVEPVSSDEKKWMAESDAHTLAEAELIMKDPDRRQAAANAAKEMAWDQMQKAKAMKRISKKGKKK